MNANNSITKLVDKIIALKLTKGIQPSELADSIFEKEYSEISFKKNDIFYEAIVKFQDIVGSEVSNITMKYIYDNDKYLLRIEEKINNKRYTVAWSRENIMRSLCNKLKSEVNYLGLSMPKLLATLPKDKYFVMAELLKLAS